MGTRRSPRNQEALWKHLGQQGATPAPQPEPRRPRTVAEVNALVGIGKADRNRMLKAAEQEELRQRVRETLALEAAEDDAERFAARWEATNA